MRIMLTMVISNNDLIPTIIHFPSEMTRSEFEDLRDTIAICLRMLERNITDDHPVPAPTPEKERGKP